MKNFKDIEQLSEYLDGKLNESESKRLKARLESDRELDSALTDLSFSRNILRQLPKRKSPKNFTLTRQMVGLKPPLPKTYPLFRLATVFATVLFVFSFSVNALSPFVNLSASQISFGYGGDAAPAAEAPVEESMMMPASATEESSEETRTAETPTPKIDEPETSNQDSAEGLENQPQVTNEALFSSNLIFTFLLLSIIGAISMFVIRQNAKRKWQ
jgi:hypothetical protein